MKKMKILAVGLGISVVSMLCACGQTTEETSSETSEAIRASREQIDLSDFAEAATEAVTEAPTVSSEAELAFVYADNWGVVHNVWELSYDPETDSYLYEYRQSGTPHQNVLESCAVSKEEGDALFALFKEKDIANAPDSVERDLGIEPSSISFGYVGDNTVYHRYPQYEDFNAIMDGILAFGENAEPPTTEETTTETAGEE